MNRFGVIMSELGFCSATRIRVQDVRLMACFGLFWRFLSLLQVFSPLCF